jgi:hypothetical protein
LVCHLGTNARPRASYVLTPSPLIRDATATVPPYRSARVLIVARRTADSPQLLEAVARRSRDGPCNFTLLVPSFPNGLRRVGDPADPGARAAERRITAAVPLLSRAAGSEVVAMIGSHEPFAAVRDALQLMGFDEVIVSTLAPGVSRWLRIELPARIRTLGVPVTEVTAAEVPTSPLPAA